MALQNEFYNSKVSPEAEEEAKRKETSRNLAEVNDKSGN